MDDWNQSSGSSDGDMGASRFAPKSGRFGGGQSAEQSEGDLTACPHCKRKLLSKRSILCNWCGRRIDDAEYLERAAHERAVADARQRDQVDQELEETARFGSWGRLKNRAKSARGPRNVDNLLIPLE